MTTKSPLDGVLSHDDLLALAHQLIEAVLAAEGLVADPEAAKAKGYFQASAKKVYAAADAIRASVREAVLRSEQEAHHA